jgi:hypothetical protein
MKLLIRKMFFLSIALMLLVGCSSKPSCTSPEPVQILNDMVKNRASDYLSKGDRGLANPTPALIADITASSIEAVLSKMSITIESIRTLQENPNNTEVSCTGVSKISIPADILKDSQEVQKIITDLSLGLGFGGSLDKEIEYRVLKSDDGKKTTLQIGNTDLNQMAGLLSTIARNEIIKPVLMEQERKRLEMVSQMEQKFKQIENFNNMMSDYIKKRGGNFTAEEAGCINTKFAQPYAKEHGDYSFTAVDLTEWDKACTANPVK